MQVIPAGIASFTDRTKRFAFGQHIAQLNVSKRIKMRVDGNNAHAMIKHYRITMDGKRVASNNTTDLRSPDHFLWQADDIDCAVKIAAFDRGCANFAEGGRNAIDDGWRFKITTPKFFGRGGFVEIGNQIFKNRVFRGRVVIGINPKFRDCIATLTWELIGNNGDLGIELLSAPHKIGDVDLDGIGARLNFTINRDEAVVTGRLDRVGTTVI